MEILPKPEVVRCYFDETVQPHIPAMELKWDPDAPGVAERTWHLPEGVCIKGPAPKHFGVTIHRRGPDAYRVRILWNQLCLSWDKLTRRQILTCAFAMVLRCLETDVWYLLEQPVEADDLHIHLAA